MPSPSKSPHSNKHPESDASTVMDSKATALPSSDTAGLPTAVAATPSGARLEWIYPWAFGALLFLPMILMFASGYQTPRTRTKMAEMKKMLVQTSSPSQQPDESRTTPPLTVNLDLRARVEKEVEALQAAREKLQQSITALKEQAPPLTSYFDLAREAASHNHRLDVPSNGQPHLLRMMHRVDWLPVMELAKKRFPESELEVQAFGAAQRRLAGDLDIPVLSQSSRENSQNRMEMERLSYAIVDWLSGEKGSAIKWYSGVASNSRSVTAILDDEQSTQERGWSAGEVHVLKAIRAALDQSAAQGADEKAQ